MQMDEKSFIETFEKEMKEYNKEANREAFASLHNFFENLMGSGFTEKQALRLIAEVIITRNEDKKEES